MVLGFLQQAVTQSRVYGHVTVRGEKRIEAVCSEKTKQKHTKHTLQLMDGTQKETRCLVKLCQVHDICYLISPTIYSQNVSH